MREEQRNYLVAGFFVLAMGAALILWLVAMAGQRGPSERYSVVYRNVMGLEPGVQILFEGYPVGFIESIEPIQMEGQQRYRVDLSVSEDFAIPRDSVAAITAPGLLSAVVIDIKGGESVETLEPGSELEGREARNVFAAMNAVAAETIDVLETDVRPLIAQMSQGTPEIMARLDSITVDLSQAVGQINGLLAQSNVDAVGRILQNFDTASANFTQLVAELREVRQEMGTLLARTEALLDEDSGELGGALVDLNHSLSAVARHIDSISANLDVTSRNMNEFSQRIRDNPGVLLRGREEGAEP